MLCFIISYNCYCIKSLRCFPYILPFPYFTITTRAKCRPLHNAVFLCLLIHRLSMHRLSMYYHIILSNIYTLCIFLHPFHPISLTFRPFPFIYLYCLYIMYIIILNQQTNNQQATTTNNANKQTNKRTALYFTISKPRTLPAVSLAFSTYF